MHSVDTTLIVRFTWLVLCGMMLCSRFLFQAAGPAWMRRFLDTWKTSRTHRAWGWFAFVFGVFVLIAGVGAHATMTWMDLTLATLLIAVLCADGLLNLVPAWFGNFKERMQDAWVSRHGTGEGASDKHLFGAVNFLLGAASLAMGAAVFLYQAMSIWWLVASVATALFVMLTLVGLCMLEMNAQIDETS